MKSLVLWLAALPMLHGADWIKVHSPNFELYTTASEHDAEPMLQTFEQVRDFFLRVKSSTVSVDLPVIIVGFNGPKEYRPYSLNEFTPAYFAGDEQRDYVVMSDLDIKNAYMAVHEYVHVLVRHSGLKIPAWLDEGMADVYSTMQQENGRILVGAIPKGRVYSLTHEKWFRLPALLAVTMQSPEYHEKDRAGIFYGESWLLVHMLMLSDRYADKFSTFVEQVSATGSSQTAFAGVYSKSVAEVEQDMNPYFRNTMGGSAYKAEMQKVDLGSAQPATELETGLILAKLATYTGHSKDAATRFDQLGATYKDNCEVEEARAYIGWRNRDPETALRYFQLAAAHGATNWKMYWDYARLLTAVKGDPEQRLYALRKALELKPDLIEAQRMLDQQQPTGPAADVRGSSETPEDPGRPVLRRRAPQRAPSRPK